MTGAENGSELGDWQLGKIFKKKVKKVVVSQQRSTVLCCNMLQHAEALHPVHRLHAGVTF